MHLLFPSLLTSMWYLAEDPPKEEAEGLFSCVGFLWNGLQRVSIPFTHLWLFSLLEKNCHTEVSLSPYAYLAIHSVVSWFADFFLLFFPL